ncbi:hypothetical protein CC1G_12166 [Coprinopsis cinerea okayama7|uniref:Uncharacterized protein n=1 Tax=Coprinopsis cinerea (strain Okayama-7 / 130 / ATCC MYA-4618 / FGSC 9003) TaxID=240176 RepID=A8N0B3_COPC7|nr:hypothetical protein CC1G_12166 [Coprinopsis cinerea okayama7\|eukprot:XP_001828325.2 hypothetical protein CC1G_12166 [Coprinopsis cinerea okayama7\
MANGSRKKIWVLVALKPEWMLADVLTDFALLFTPVGAAKALAGPLVDLPGEIKTVEDLTKYMIFNMQHMSARAKDGALPDPAAQSILDAFKAIAVPIDAGHVKKVNDEWWINYINPDGIASLFDSAKTLNVLVMSDDGLQFAAFGTNNDHSWIATDRGSIVRSRYGTIWQQDPDAGSVTWAWSPK